MKLLGNSSFWVVNKSIAKEFGIDSSVFLSHIIDKEQFYGIDENGFFYHTCEQIENEIYFSKYEQQKIIKKLEKAGFIETKIFGLPARRNFKILSENILTFILQKEQEAKIENIEKGRARLEENNENNRENNFKASSKKICPLDGKKFALNNNIYNNNININNINNNNFIKDKIITEKQDFSDFSESLENFENKEEEIIETIEITPDNISRLSHKHFEEVETPKERPTFGPNPKKEKRKSSEKKKKESESDFVDAEVVEAEIVEETTAITYGNQNINQIIAIMQAELEANGLFYQKEGADRNYAKHICTAKEFGAIAEKFGMNRAEFVVNIIRLSCESDFWRGKICNPRSLYKGYVKVLNEASARQFRKSQEKEYNFDLTNGTDDFFSN